MRIRSNGSIILFLEYHQALGRIATRLPQTVNRFPAFGTMLFPSWPFDWLAIVIRDELTKQKKNQENKNNIKIMAIKRKMQKTRMKRTKLF